MLREVADSDLAAFFEHQRDPVAAAMAAFPSRDRAHHLAHWQRILADPSSIARTVDIGGVVAGNVISWRGADGRYVGYWLGRRYWGRGVATAALLSFVAQVDERPLHALVARSNVGSVRVLQKCGFVLAAEQPLMGEDGVDEWHYVLHAGEPV